MTVQLMRESVQQTLQTCGMIIWVGVGATMLVGVYNLMGGIKFVETLLLGFGTENPMNVLLLMMFILFILGMFLDWVGVALLTIPCIPGLLF